jgi:PqqD family protein of HPr-rel-A system
VPHPDVLSRRVDDEVVLVDMRTNEIFALNPTGARLWELLQDGADEQAALATMLDEFDVPADRLRAETAAFLDQLGRQGLVSRAGG